MTVIVRDLRPDDRRRRGLRRVRRAALPFMVSTAEAVRLDRRAAPTPTPTTGCWSPRRTARSSARPRSASPTTAREPGQGYVNVYVHPDAPRPGRRRAAGAHRRGAPGGRGRDGRVYAWVLDEPENRAFAERHGYRAEPLRALPAPGPGERHAAPAAGAARRASNCAPPPTSPTTRARCSRLDAEATADEPSDIGAEFDDYERLARAHLEPPAARPRADHGRRWSTAARRLQRGPHGRRHPLCVRR